MLAHVPRRSAVVAALLIGAAIVLGVLGEDLAALIAGGLGGIIAVSAAFYAVGRSEDADRERGAV